MFNMMPVRVHRKHLRKRSYVDHRMELPYPRLIRAALPHHKIKSEIIPEFKPTFRQRCSGMRYRAASANLIPYTHYDWCVIEFDDYIKLGTHFERLEFANAVYHAVEVKQYSSDKGWSYYCNVKHVELKEI